MKKPKNVSGIDDPQYVLANMKYLRHCKIEHKDTGKVTGRNVYILRARLTLNDVSSLTIKERAKLIIWLRQQADDIRREGKNYSKHFTARYLA
jgi:hypothetical protein